MTRLPFTTKWALQCMPERSMQEQVEQTALEYLMDTHRRWMRDVRRLKTDLPKWEWWAECALEHALDIHDQAGWTTRRMDATTDWLARAAEEAARVAA